MTRSALKIAALMCCLAATDAFGETILFIGNSFTYGAGAPVMRYKAASVIDLNGEGFGGVPALFKSFTAQAGLKYDVSLETHPGVGIDWRPKSPRYRAMRERRIECVGPKAAVSAQCESDEFSVLP